MKRKVHIYPNDPLYPKLKENRTYTRSKSKLLEVKYQRLQITDKYIIALEILVIKL